MMKNDSDAKHVFVCGLPRSGTSLLGRNVARLEDCTGFKNTGVLEDEGQFLQDVYRSDHEMGGAGSFGFHPDAHLTETSALLTPQNAERLRHCWEPYWDPSKRIRVEKTPGNLLMTRFLQAVFPNAYFVVLKRHPVAVSMATQKWKDSVRSLDYLFQHWLHCHQLFEDDKNYLTHVYELRYEDYVEHQERFHRKIAAFIGTRVPNPTNEDDFRAVVAWRKPNGRRVPEKNMERTSAQHNKKYFDRWQNLLTTSRCRAYYRYLTNEYESRFAMYGYSLLDGCSVIKQQVSPRYRIHAVVGPALCAGADTVAWSRRLIAQSKEWLRLTSKTILPKLIVDNIRTARNIKAARNAKRRLLATPAGNS